jgi:hypothetical protein
VPTPLSYQDRIVVRQRNTDGTPGAVVVDTAVGFTGPAGLPLQPGESRTRTYAFTLPEGVRGAGQFDVTVTADGTSILFETNASGNAEGNNQSSSAFTSAAKPYADLGAAQLDVPAQAASGALVVISWSVANGGQAAAVGTWVDRIVLSQDATIGNADDIVLANVLHAGGLAVGASYAQSASVRIPTRIEGSYRIAVIVDADSAVLEPDTRADNRRVSAPVTVTQTYADLAPTLTVVPTEVFAGRSAQVEWSVRNQGTITTDVGLWTDQVYLSTTPALSASAILLGSVTHAGALSVGASYGASLSAQIPRNVSGPMYFVVRSDAFGAVYELGRTANNVVAAASSSQVLAEPRPNLVIESVQTSGTCSGTSATRQPIPTRASRSAWSTSTACIRHACWPTPPPAGAARSRRATRSPSPSA